MSKKHDLPAGVVVFCYHRVLPDQGHCREDERMRVSAASFERQMELVARMCMPVHLSEAVDALERGRCAKGLHACVTFDDGYADVLDFGLPILQKLGIPFTFFITTDFVESQMVPWWERPGPAQKRGSQGEWPSQADRCKPHDGQDLLSPSSEGSGQCSPRPLSGNRLFCTWQSLSHHLQGGLMELGCHTASHAMLSRCPDGGKSEIVRSREALATRLGIEASLFAYPFGMTSHIGRLAPTILKKHKFKAAVTVRAGINRPGIDAFLLRRLIVTGRDTEDSLLHKIKTADMRGRLQGLTFRLRSPDCIYSRHTKARTSEASPSTRR